MNRGSRTSEIINSVDFQKNGLDHVVAQQLEAMIVKQMRDVLTPSGEEIVERQSTSCPSANKPFAQVRTNESGAAVTSTLKIFENALGTLQRLSGCEYRQAGVQCQ